MRSENSPGLYYTISYNLWKGVKIFASSVKTSLTCFHSFSAQLFDPIWPLLSTLLAAQHSHITLHRGTVALWSLFQAVLECETNSVSLFKMAPDEREHINEHLKRQWGCTQETSFSMNTLSNLHIWGQQSSADVVLLNVKGLLHCHLPSLVILLSVGRLNYKLLQRSVLHMKLLFLHMWTSAKHQTHGWFHGRWLLSPCFHYENLYSHWQTDCIKTVCSR